MWTPHPNEIVEEPYIALRYNPSGEQNQYPPHPHQTHYPQQAYATPFQVQQHNPRTPYVNRPVKRTAEAERNNPQYGSHYRVEHPGNMQTYQHQQQGGNWGQNMKPSPFYTNRDQGQWENYRNMEQRQQKRRTDQREATVELANQWNAQAQ